MYKSPKENDFDQAQFIRRDQTGTGRVTAQCEHQVGAEDVDG